MTLAAAYAPEPRTPYEVALDLFQRHHDLVRAGQPGLPPAQLAEAFREYQLRWRSSALQVGRRYAAPDDLEDVLQEAAITVWTKILRGDIDPSQSEFYVYRQAVMQRGIDRFRRRRLPVDELPEDSEWASRHPDEPRQPTPEETVLAQFDADEVLDLCARSGCSPRETHLIVLRYVADLDWDGVLDQLNQTPPPIQRPAMQNKHRTAKIRIRDYLTHIRATNRE